MRRIILPLVLATCSLLAPTAHADCPLDTLVLVADANNETQYFSANVASASQSTPNFVVPGYVNRKSQSVSYDLQTGVFHAAADLWISYLAGFANARGEARAHDTYSVLGPSGAAATTFTVRWRIVSRDTGGFAYIGMNGPTMMPPGHVHAVLREGANAAEIWRGTDGSYSGSYDDALELTITRAPGEAFDLAFLLAAIADGQADLSDDRGSNRTAVADATLSFPDLPEGWSIVSCQGFQAGQIVPTRHSTWGRVKTAHR